MNLHSKYVKNTFIYISQTVVTTVIPFMVMLLVARYVEPKDFGLFALAQVYAVVLTGVFSLGLHIGYERNYFKYQGNPQLLGALHYSLLLFVTALYIVGGVLTYFFIDQLGPLIGVTEVALVMVILGGLSLDKLAQLYLIFYRNSESAGSYARYMVFAAVLNALLTVILVVVCQMGILGVAYGYAVSWGIIVITMAFNFRKIMPFCLRWVVLKEALILSVPLSPRSLTVLVGAQSDKYMLGMLNSIGGVGIYSLATRISSVINSYMIALQNVYTPLLFKSLFSERSREDQNLTDGLTAITYLSLIPAVFLSLFAGEVIVLLLPEGYHAVGPALVVLAVYYGAIFFGKITSKQLVYAEKTGLTTLLAIIFALINVALNVPFIYYMGVLGAALATLFTGAIYTAASFILAQKYCRLEWNLRQIVAMIVLLFISGGTTLAFQFWYVSFELSLAVRGLLLLAYLYLGVWSGVVSQGNFTRLVAAIKN